MFHFHDLIAFDSEDLFVQFDMFHHMTDLVNFKYMFNRNSAAMSSIDFITLFFHVFFWLAKE